MKSRLRRVRLRDLGLFVVVAVIVTVVAVIAGREAGIGDRAGAAIEVSAPDPQPAAREGGSQERDQSGNGLSVALKAAETCETLTGVGLAGSEFVRVGGVVQRNPNGTLKRRDVPSGWSWVGEIAVEWTVTGGAGPYTLQIDGESEDLSGAYEGAQGTAAVTCALAYDEIFIEEYADGRRSRRFRSKPTVDSGWKTIRAVVTDAHGRTAEATKDIYVIQLDAWFLTKGETYRTWGGHLVTAPSSYDMYVASPAEFECAAATDAPADPYECEPWFSLVLLPDGHQGDWLLGFAGLQLYERDATEKGRLRRQNDGTWVEITPAVRALYDDDDPVFAALDEMARLVNQPPAPR